jgi:hypothetical protein
MKKPSLINCKAENGILVQGTCPICRATFAHNGKPGENTENQVPAMYARHLQDRHLDVLAEDASQAAIRIVRQATEKTS